MAAALVAADTDLTFEHGLTANLPPWLYSISATTEGLSCELKLLSQSMDLQDIPSSR